MNLKYTIKIINIIFEYKLNNTEIIIFLNALVLSQSANEFSFDRHRLRFKTNKTRQHISKSILSLEKKGLIEQIGRHENKIQHKFCEEVYLCLIY